MTTFDMISITISIIGLLGGFSSWFYMWLKSRLNIRIRILSKLIKSRTNFILLYMSFSNESTLPVAITAINLIIEDKPIHCLEVPDIVLSRTSRSGSTVTNQEKHYSMEIPINIPALSATSGYVLFPVGPDIQLPSSNILSFEVHTNRGVIDRIALQLPAANLVPMEDN
ncbi:hypothetical protein C5Q96_06795 [Mogibacterium diversum]|uniref:Uncharacterized protein n=1 Tax=Mogibacterium diversum TaxID=114527 RepID=A0A2S0L5K3_9FIRM|nr:hypothetical protein [Mogibacterium diversum]AVM48569.1 hypothetical protein C5Q96_06795 [Mogibacterium diversum]